MLAKACTLGRLRHPESVGRAQEKLPLHIKPGGIGKNSLKKKKKLFLQLVGRTTNTYTPAPSHPQLPSYLPKSFPQCSVSDASWPPKRTGQLFRIRELVFTRSNFQPASARFHVSDVKMIQNDLASPWFFRRIHRTRPNLLGGPN